MYVKRFSLLAAAAATVVLCTAPRISAQDISATVLHADRVFDGLKMYDDWVVVVSGNRIVDAGPVSSVSIPEDADMLRFEGATLLPGLIDAHSHLLLHPYNETSWNDQVLKESFAERAIRAGVHAGNTLRAGFTSLRDLGSEGAGYVDVGVKQAIEKGVIPGPRLIVSGKAIVATGSYGPKGFAEHVHVPLGAEEADGLEGIQREVRDQIGNGADFIKVYADYRWGPNGEARPTFSIEELQQAVATAGSSGRTVVAHASTAEAMRRATIAGVESIEHGDGGTPEVFQMMAEAGVILCPTIAAGHAIMQYGGWDPGTDSDPERIVRKKQSIEDALEAGVTLCNGSDVGVFSHGDNPRELELMVDYGVSPLGALTAATSVNAKLMHMEDAVGRVQTGFLADIVIVDGNPAEAISDIRNVVLVMKDGEIVVGPR
ncbi:MAG: amidohydrolase family protein [Rhodothermales bacterium]|nr:amidohydrolase family protein [Rhodothermales bacterium]